MIISIYIKSTVKIMSENKKKEKNINKNQILSSIFKPTLNPSLDPPSPHIGVLRKDKQGGEIKLKLLLDKMLK